MSFNFFRKTDDTEMDGIDLSFDLMNDTTEVHTQDWKPQVHIAPMPQVDTLLRSRYSKIGVASMETPETSDKPILFDAQQPSPLLQVVTLPHNPRIATDELYQLEATDLIIFMVDDSMDKYAMRWVSHLRQLGVPVIVLMRQITQKRNHKQQLDAYAQFIGVPVVPVISDRIGEARQQLVEHTLVSAPSMAFALAAHLPDFREYLLDKVQESHITESLTAPETASGQQRSLHEVQVDVVQQISAAHGCNGRALEAHMEGLQNMIHTANQVTAKFTSRLPFRDEARRQRFTNAVSTLFLCHATDSYHGADAPSIRRDLFPQLWKLYRASRHAVSG